MEDDEIDHGYEDDVIDEVRKITQRFGLQKMHCRGNALPLL